MNSTGSMHDDAADSSSFMACGLDVRTRALDGCLARCAHAARRDAKASGEPLSEWACKGGAFPLDVLSLIDERVRAAPTLLAAPRQPSHAAVKRLLRKVGIGRLRREVGMGWFALKEAVEATTLDWRNKDLDAKDAEVVAYVVAASGSLTKLFLGRNRFGDEGAKALAAGVAASSSMATLYLYGNDIGDVGAKAIASAIGASGSLAVLRLGGNNIGDDAKQSLRDAVQIRQGFNLGV